MKKKIYVFPDNPSKNELETIIGNFSPPLNVRIKDQVFSSFTQIQERLRDIPVNQTRHHVHHTQSLSDGRHTITLIGRLTPPSLFEKLKEFFK